MIDKINIRNAEEKDVSTILSLIKELAEYEKMSDEVIATEEKIFSALFGKNKIAECILAEYDTETAGFALFFHNFSTFVAKPGLYLEDLYVKPHLRGKGIGKALLVHLIRLAKKRNCGRMEWAVLNWNEPAIKFYKKLGAQPMDEWTVYRLTEDKFEEF